MFNINQVMNAIDAYRRLGVRYVTTQDIIIVTQGSYTNDPTCPQYSKNANYGRWLRICEEPLKIIKVGKKEYMTELVTLQLLQYGI